MPGKAKRHHVVPRFYLERFARGEHVTVVRRGEKPYTGNVKDTGVVGQFNLIVGRDGEPSLVIEEMYRDFEGTAKPIIEEIAATGFIPMHHPRSLLAQYMALQYTRTPEWRDVADIQTEIMAKTLMLAHTDDSLWAMLAEMQGREPTEEEFAAGKYARDHIDDFTIELSNNDFFQGAIRTATDDIMPYLLQQMHWDLIQVEEPTFITSDHPIVFARPPGIPIGILDALQVFFPIDPWRALMLTKGPVRESRLLGINPETARKIDQIIADRSYEWVAHHPDQQKALEGIEIPADSPLISVNGATIYGDKRGIAGGVDEMRQLVESARRAASWRAAKKAAALSDP
jgi:hypothetical protein